MTDGARTGATVRGGIGSVAHMVDRGYEATAWLPADARSAREARRFAGEILASWGQERHYDLVALLTSELVTNAVLHAGSDVVVTVRRDRRAVRVEVSDGDTRVPAPPGRVPPTATRGRGLMLVDLLATCWGIDERRDGKTIWFELDC